ncbi:ABC transporter ATP-binding protein [Oceanobacillus oncorhynchi subsp. incaldanensis]|uniref:Oligopeptide transport ATP-binding protein OppD n=2 Tax=Oceanobacillus oncorhynchi TaxID=545501 RepID=A0A0A1MJE9_9BACI|nr:ABC transporter ATP-binding protein [Oceanobacillus oncorhynchi subsp. incaldanensis]CEI83213.1 Oligopeptide transport ATP-binding protein OppD [Oceanobacillus oncorhynchi]
MVMLEVKNLSIQDTQSNEVIVEDISFKLERGRSLGIVGESGSGKSMTVKGMLGLIAPWITVSGAAYFEDADMLRMKTKSIRDIRARHISMILQDAMSAFDSLDTIGKQMQETLCENLIISRTEAKQVSLRELERVGIKEAAQVLKKYPHQLSGGMLQRCMIAIAAAVQPDIIIADEPTTALDAITQKEVIATFQHLQAQSGTTFIFISHDLGVIQQLTEDVLVMKDAKQVEYGRTENVFQHPQNEYTKYLVDTRIKLTRAFEQSMRKDSYHA